MMSLGAHCRCITTTCLCLVIYFCTHCSSSSSWWQRCSCFARQTLYSLLSGHPFFNTQVSCTCQEAFLCTECILQCILECIYGVFWRCYSFFLHFSSLFDDFRRFSLFCRLFPRQRDVHSHCEHFLSTTTLTNTFLQHQSTTTLSQSASRSVRPALCRWCHFHQVTLSLKRSFAALDHSLMCVFMQNTFYRFCLLRSMQALDIVTLGLTFWAWGLYFPFFRVLEHSAGSLWAPVKLPLSNNVQQSQACTFNTIILYFIRHLFFYNASTQPMGIFAWKRAFTSHNNATCQ